MDEKNNVPYIVYEGEQARHERTFKRLTIALVITIMLLFATNALWLNAWMQYDYVGQIEATQNVDVDAKDGVANYVGHDGDIVNGADHGNDKNNISESTSAEESE